MSGVAGERVEVAVGLLLGDRPVLQQAVDGRAAGLHERVDQLLLIDPEVLGD